MIIDPKRALVLTSLSFLLTLFTQARWAAAATNSQGCVATFPGIVVRASNSILVVGEPNSAEGRDFRLLSDTNIVTDEGGRYNLSHLSAGDKVTVYYEACTFLHSAANSVVITSKRKAFVSKSSESSYRAHGAANREGSSRHCAGCGARGNGNRGRENIGNSNFGRGNVGNGNRVNATPAGASEGCTDASGNPVACSVITGSVYDFIDVAKPGLPREHSERAGYGRYTYVLLTNQSATNANSALLTAVMRLVGGASTSEVPVASLNVFEIPEKTVGSSSPQSAAGAVKNYDFDGAQLLYHEVCTSQYPPDICKGSGVGAFMLTFAFPIGSQVNVPFLVVDLHALNPKGYDQMVALMLEQVKQPGFSSGEIVNGWKAWILTWTLDATDWLPDMLKAYNGCEKPVDCIHQVVTGH